MSTELEVEDGGLWEMRETTIRLKYGIHSRPAALIARAATAFQAEILLCMRRSLTIDGQTIHGDAWGYAVSAKSIMGLMTLEAHDGAIVRLQARGPDAITALDALEAVLNEAE